MLARCCLTTGWRAATRAAVLPTWGCCAVRSPWCRSLCTPSSAPAPSAATATDATQFAPSYSRWARRERLLEALANCAEGEEFKLPPPQPRTLPGPCGAVMNVLRDNTKGPLKTAEIFAECEERYPGALRSKAHLKQKILMRALKNKVLKARLPGAPHLDRWTLRDPGETRSRFALRR